VVFTSLILIRIRYIKSKPYNSNPGFPLAGKPGHFSTSAFIPDASSAGPFLHPSLHQHSALGDLFRYPQGCTRLLGENREARILFSCYLMICGLEIFMDKKQIMILGVGCILFSDEGFGIRVIERLQEQYEFPENVSVLDGGVLGVNLLGVISQTEHLIVVDAIRSRGKPGDMYRLVDKQIPERIRAKNSIHQVDFLEALTLCQALDKVPDTVIVGVEPEDIDTLSIELTPVIQSKVAPMIQNVLKELDRLEVPYYRRKHKHVSRNPI
jgi:hydrogenase maturation protease